MGSRLGGSGSAPAVLLWLLHGITSWLAALLSVIPLLRAALPSAKVGTRRVSSCAVEQQRQQLPAAAEPEPGRAARQAGQDSLPGREVPPGYDASVEQLRRAEFKRLQGRVYADYAGAAPYSELLLTEVLQDLSTSLHGNPHSEAGWAPESRSAAADAARLATLRWCSADPEQYVCIFTAGATAALKLVGESFSWGPASAFAHLRDNHTSVLGIRQLAAQHGAACPAAAVEVAAAAVSNEAQQQQAGSSLWCLSPCGEVAAAGLRAAAHAAGAAQRGGAGSSSVEEPQHLFALPLESNFSGVRYDQRLVAAVQSGSVRWSCASSSSSSSSSGSSGSGSSSNGDSAVSSSGGSSQAGPTGECGSDAQPLPAGRWRVLLDAAKGAATRPPDLSAFPADFVALSFYKAFGWPTGLGALLVRRDALACLRRRYFGGGTVELALADEPFHRLRPGPGGWEDGTPAFLDLPAVAAGFRFIERLGGFPAMEAHASAVASSLAAQLAALRHWNGAPVCTLYGAHAGQPQQGQAQAEEQLQQEQSHGDAPAEPPLQEPWQQQPHPLLPQEQQQRGERQPQQPPLPPGVAGQGPVVAFNLRRADGSFVGYREVERLASLCGIMLRTGCMCNPGACAAALGLSAADMRANWAAGHVCWDGHDIIRGRPTGAVRASFGFASSLADAEAVVALVQQYFVEEQPAEGAALAQHASRVERTMPAAGCAEAAQQAVASTASAALAAAGPVAAAAAAAAGAAAGDAAAGASHAAADRAAASPAAAAPAATLQRAGQVGALWVYPIKSCRGFSPPAWPLGPTGLMYDRCWALVDSSGSALRLKQHPGLAGIGATVDLQRRLLLVTTAGEEQPLEVPLPAASGAEAQACCGQGRLGSDSGRSPGGSGGSGGSSQDRSGSPSSPSSCTLPSAGPSQPFSVRVCSRTAWVQRSAAAAGGDAAAAAWFSRVLGTPCRLVQQATQPSQLQQAAQPSQLQQAAQPSQPPRSGASAATAEAEAGAGAGVAADDGAGNTSSSNASTSTTISGSGSSSRSFANEGQLLVLGAASLADLASRAGSREALDVFAQRFRPNLVVEGSSPYAEDGWGCLNLMPAAAGASKPPGSSTAACGWAPDAAAAGASVPAGGSTGACAAAAGAATCGSETVQLASAGPCARCDMVCINPLTGRRSGPEPLLTLAGYRRRCGRIAFGQLMNVAQPQQLPSLRHLELGAQQQAQQPLNMREAQQQTEQPMQQLGGTAGLCPGGGGTCARCGGTCCTGGAAPPQVAVGDAVYVLGA